MSLSFPRNLFISVWFARGRQEGKRNGTVESCGFHLAVYKSPRAHRLFGEGGEAQRACCHPLLIYHPGALTASGKPRGGLQIPREKTHWERWPQGPFPTLFSSLSVVLSVSAWQHKHNCLLLGKSKLTYECLPEASTVLPHSSHPTVSCGSARGAVLTLDAAIAPCGLSALCPFPLFSRCLSEYFCSWSLACEHFTLSNGLAADGPDFPLLALEAHSAPFVFLDIS